MYHYHHLNVFILIKKYRFVSLDGNIISKSKPTLNQIYIVWPIGFGTQVVVNENDMCNVPLYDQQGDIVSYNVITIYITKFSYFTYN